MLVRILLTNKLYVLVNLLQTLTRRAKIKLQHTFVVFLARPEPTKFHLCVIVSEHIIVKSSSQ